jgi:predicted nicotinamide N-methyase
MLVIVSDGNYTYAQSQSAIEALTECKRNGVAVLVISPKGCDPRGARSIIAEAAWGVHLTEMDTDQIAMSVGKAATDALNRVGNLA